jgi:hypothetical protein
MLSLHAPTTNPALLAHDWYCPWWHAPEGWALGQTEAWKQPSLLDLARLICLQPWAPAIYRGGVRRESHFIQSRLIVLDYDDGLTLEQAMQKFARYRYIIGTTKSHQKQKGDKPPCDRFRVVLFFMHNVYSLQVYKENYAKYVEHAGSDAACKDGARFFFPCVEIIACNEGYSIPYLVSPTARRTTIRKDLVRNDKEQIVANKTGSEHHIPKKEYHAPTGKSKRKWSGIEAWAKNSYTETKRNISCFQAACDLFEMGKTESEVEDWIKGVGTSLEEEQIMTCIRSARKRKKGA